MDNAIGLLVIPTVSKLHLRFLHTNASSVQEGVLDNSVASLGEITVHEMLLCCGSTLKTVFFKYIWSEASLKHYLGKQS